MKRDSDQQAAIDVTTNAVVSAGAGSGKTSVLTSRYLRLVVDEHVPVSSILALTFTRKAAAEMYDRIYRALVEHRDDPFVAAQLADFDRSVISTLDSFCASVARNGCAAYGIASTFAVDEETLSSTCDELALAFLVENAGDPAIGDLIRLNRFGPLWRDGLARLAVDRFLVGDSRTLSDFMPKQRAFVESELVRIESEIRRGIDVIIGLDPRAATCVANAQAALEAVELERVFAGAESSGVRATELAKVTSIRLSCGSSKHPDVALLKEAVTSLRSLADRYLLAAATIERWSDQERVVELLDRFRERVIAQKQRLGLLAYRDVVSLAIRVLTDNLHIRAYYKKRFRAIMIDEFQDNNDEQKALLYLVAEADDRSTPGIPPPEALDPGKLFFVGDEKQSIYRFRGADVSVFRTLAAELSGADAALYLGANYRSEPGLVRFFNELFSRVFAGATQNYEARFEALRSRDASPGVAPRAELWTLEHVPVSDPDHLEDIDAESFHIASFIRDEVERRSLTVGDGVDETGVRREGRPAEYGDFAILMRSTSNQIRLERMLRRFAIPYVSQSARSLFLEAPVNDIYQILQLAVYPVDRVAYAGYLRSPLVGLSDEGLVRQLVTELPLFDAAPGHTPDDLRRLELARERYDEIVSIADSVPITRLLHRIWYEWGYRYHLLRREEYLPYLEYFDLFRELAHTFESRGLTAFLDEVRLHIGQNEKLNELELLRGEATGVNLMTVHKSKGLEFPVVIVANAGNKGRTESASSSPYHWSDTFGLAMNTGVLPAGAVRERAANYIFTHEAEEESAQARAELLRLLYVAATRAESHLIVSGVSPANEASLLGVLEGPFAQAADVLSGAPDVSVTIRELEAVASEAELTAYRATGRRAIADLARVYETIPVVDRTVDPIEITATALNDLPRAGDAAPRGGSADSIESPEHPVDAILTTRELATAFGTLCHACIEHGGRPAALPGDVRSAFAELGERDRKRLVDYADELADRFRTSPTGVRIATARERLHELPFLLAAGELPRELQDAAEFRVVRGQIDLVAEFDDQVLIVDFKSDRVLDPDEYRVQLRVYERAAAAIFEKPVDVELYHLRTGRSISILFDSVP